MYARAFILCFDTLFGMAPLEQPVKMRSWDVDLGDVTELQRRTRMKWKRQ